jgi:Ca2+-binding RTX toxin-like protein
MMIHGGLGADVLQVLGADTYASPAIGGGNVDAAVGFNVADDTFLLNNSIFTGLLAPSPART